MGVGELIIINELSSLVIINCWFRRISIGGLPGLQLKLIESNQMNCNQENSESESECLWMFHIHFETIKLVKFSIYFICWLWLLPPICRWVMEAGNQRGSLNWFSCTLQRVTSDLPILPILLVVLSPLILLLLAGALSVETDYKK